MNQGEQEAYENDRGANETSEESMTSGDEEMEQIEDGPKPVRTEQERQTEVVNLRKREPGFRLLKKVSCPRYGSMKCEPRC